MAAKTNYSEILPVRLPVGAKQELALLAKSRYQSPCSLARQAIMAEIEKAQNACGVCLVPSQGLSMTRRGRGRNKS